MPNRAVDESRSAEAWGSVRRGFAVRLANGRHGSVADIRIEGSGAVELVVATGLFFRTTVTIGAAETEAILPGKRRIIVGQPHDRGHEPRPNADAETIAAPLRLIKDASSTDSPLDAA